MKNAPVTAVWWCPRCPGKKEITQSVCPTCDHPAASLGYRVGFHRGNYQYYSSIERLPRDLRECV